MRDWSGRTISAAIVLLFGTISAGVAHAASAPCASTVVSSSISVAGTLTDIFLDDQCQYVYATNSDKNQVEVFSLQTGELLAPIPVGSKPVSIDASLDGGTLYVANSGGTNVSVINATTRAETRKITMPTANENGFPNSVAVARNGLVFIATRGLDTTPSGKLFQYNPATSAVTERTFPGQSNWHTRVDASPDRHFLAMSSESGAGPLYRYSSATNALTVSLVSASARSVAFDRSGATALVSAGGYVLNAAFESLGTIGGANRGVAIDPDDRAVGYVVDSHSVRMCNLQTFEQTGNFTLISPVGNTAGRGVAAISQDGALLAVTTANGFEIVRLKGTPIYQTVRFIGFSTSQLNESLLRFYNQATLEGRVKVTLYDVTTKDKLAEWLSPPILANSAPQFSIGSVEDAAPQPFTKRSHYIVELESRFKGTFAHILWQRSNSLLTNASTCDSGTSDTTQLVNVHSSLLDGLSPSYLSIVNADVAPASPTLGIYNALTGFRVGNYAVPSIPGSGVRLISMADIETAARITASRGPYYHYVIKVETPFTGYLQHLMGNRQTGIVSDLTKVCPLP